MRKTYVWRDGVMVEKTGHRTGKSWQVLSDIEPFVAPGGDYITSRSQLRAYEHANGVRQIGNDWPGSTKPKFWDRVKNG